MKKLLIMMVALAVAFSAGAWSRNLDKGVLLLASKTLTPKAQRTLTNYVGEDHSKPAGHLAWHRKNGRHLETEGWHTLHLDANLLPAAQDENDALVQIEKALEVIKNRKKHSTAEVSFAIQTVMNLVIDMHNLSNVALEKYPLSGTDFKMNTTKGTAGGKKATVYQTSWKVQWTHRYVHYHGAGAYSPQMWADELEVMFGDKKEEFTAGTLRDWTHDIGKYSDHIYSILEKEGGFYHATIHEYDIFHMSCVAKAAYRLGALLNQYLN